MNQKTAVSRLVVALMLFASRPSIAVLPLPETAPFFERIAVEINGNRLLLSGSQPIELVKGDLLIINDAWVERATSQQVDAIDLVGYAPRGPSKKRDDRSFVIHTGRDLQAKFSLNPEQTDFELKGFIGEQLVGRAVIRVQPARLDRVEISLNGKLQSLRNGEVLRISSKDKIAVQSVVTNVRGNENVVHQIQSQKNAKGQATKELVFARDGQIFGRIPIQWQE